jgi:hypothetical protein
MFLKRSKQQAGNKMGTWLGERVRDLVMWPVNLVRDFPVRMTRLAKTVWRGIRGVVFLLPEAWRASRKPDFGGWLRWKGGRFFDGLHQFLTQIFDLLGGPEIGEFLLHLAARTTPLTADETEAIASVLGPEAMRFRDVRVVEGGVFDWIFERNGGLAFATWHSINLPRTGRHTRQNLPIVVHELTHVYQYEQVGSRYLGEAIYMLIKTKRDCYNYGGAAGLEAAYAGGRRYRDFNREQQAKITQDYYDLKSRGKDVTAYDSFIAQVQAGDL